MPLPSNVQLLPEPDVTRLILPTRQRTGPLWVGCIPMIFGMFFAGFAVFWMLGAMGALNGPPHPIHPPVSTGPEAPVPPPVAPTGFQWTRLIFSLFGIPFIIVGLIPIGIGILTFFPSHAEILITAEKLISVNQIGPFRIRRRRTIATIGTLRIGPVFERSTSRPALPLNYGIFAETAPVSAQSSPPLGLAQRYSVEMLTPIAQFLLAELKRRGASSLHHAESLAPAAPITLTIDPDPMPAPTAAEPVEEPAVPQPENSKIVFLPAADSLTFIVPRTGFRGTALFFLMFSLFWDGISFTFFGGMLIAFIHEPSLESLGILAFLSIFVAIGIGTLLAAIQSAFRKAVVLATRDALVLTQTGPIRKSEFQWNPAELTAIRCGDSNTTINGKRLQELQVVATTKSSPVEKGAFTGRDDAELRWLAATLRRFYQIKTT